MSEVAITAPSIVEPLPATRPLAWWVRALDVVSGLAVLLLISIVVFGGFRLRYGELRITAQDVWRPLAVLVLAAGLRHWRMPRPSEPSCTCTAAAMSWATPPGAAVSPRGSPSRLPPQYSASTTASRLSTPSLPRCRTRSPSMRT